MRKKHPTKPDKARYPSGNFSDTKSQTTPGISSQWRHQEAQLLEHLTMHQCFSCILLRYTGSIDNAAMCFTFPPLIIIIKQSYTCLDHTPCDRSHGQLAQHYSHHMSGMVEVKDTTQNPNPKPQILNPRCTLESSRICPPAGCMTSNQTDSAQHYAKEPPTKDLGILCVRGLLTTSQSSQT